MRPVNELRLTLAEAYTHGTSTYVAVAEDLAALIAAGELETAGVVRVFDDAEWVLLRYAGVDTANNRLTDLSAAAPRNASENANGHTFAVGSSVWGCVAADYIRSLLDNTDPVTQSFGDAASPGTAEVAARRDHKHGMPSLNVAIAFVIDGGGSAITTGSKGYLEIPFACTVTGWTIVGSPSGSIVVDVKRATYANFPTTSSIAGTEKPTLSSATKNQDLDLTAWTTSIAAGDILEFVVDSASTVKKVTIVIRATRS